MDRKPVDHGAMDPRVLHTKTLQYSEIGLDIPEISLMLTRNTLTRRINNNPNKSKSDNCQSEQKSIKFQKCQRDSR